MRRKFIKRAVIAASVLAGSLYTTSFFVRSEVESGSAAWLNAAQIDTLGTLLGEVNAVVWPRYAADPFSCNGNATGGYYFNTTSNDFRTCDGSSWSPSGGGVASLTNFDDVLLTAPADNDVLRYRSTPGTWLNSAAASHDLDGLSDVVITDPEPLEILTYTGSNWENSGNSPSTLEGLTDTTITTPVEGDHLVHDGSDWKNSPGFVDTPYFLYAHNPSGGALGAYNVGGTNTVVVYRVVIPYEIAVNKMIWRTNSATDSRCSCQGIAIYSADGNTLIGSGTFDQSGGLTSQTMNNIDVDFTVGPGEYWLAATGNFWFGASCSFYAYASTTTFDQIMNTEATKIGHSANTSNAVTCAFPSTLGTVTGQTNKARPVIYLEGR